MGVEGWQTWLLCIAWGIYVFPFSKLTAPIPMQSGRVGENDILCADLDISCIFHQIKFLEKLSLTPHQQGWGLLNLSFVHFWTFNAFSNKKIFQWIGPQILMLEGKSLEFPVRVSLKLHLIGKVVLVFLEIISGGFYRYLGQQYAAKGIFSCLPK